MYCVEMLVEEGYWTVRTYAGSVEGLRHNTYEWVTTGSRWERVGGLYATPEEAEEKIDSYRLCGSSQKPKRFRVAWP